MANQRFFNEAHEDDEAAGSGSGDIDRRTYPEGYEQPLAHPEEPYQLPHEDPYRLEEEPEPDEVYGKDDEAFNARKS